MNCQDFEKLILLQDSSELPETQHDVLMTHLQTCKSCQKVKAELPLLRELLSPAMQTQQVPSQEAIRGILAAAQKQQARKPWGVQHFWPVALAAAAGVALCVSTLRFQQEPGTTPTAVVQTTLASEIIPLIAMISGTEPGEMFKEKDDTELTVLADEFLRLQDITLDWPAEINDNTTLPEDYQPTTLLWNNTRALPSERCG